MNRCEFLQRLCTPELGHCTLSSPEGLVGVFRPVVQPTPGFLAIGISNQLHCCCSRFLNPYTVTRILKQAAERAGIEASLVQQISSHSMRVGAAQDLILNGHNILMIMAAGGWRSINVVGRYVENVGLRIWN